MCWAVMISQHTGQEQKQPPDICNVQMPGGWQMSQERFLTVTLKSSLAIWIPSMVVVTLLWEETEGAGYRCGEP